MTGSIADDGTGTPERCANARTGHAGPRRTDRCADALTDACLDVAHGFCLPAPT